MTDLWCERLTMNANVASVLEPLNKHFEAVIGELIAQLGSFDVVVAEIRRGMVFTLPAPVEK